MSGSRIRSIKPEFWTDEKLSECSVSARLLFIASWNFADDEGGIERSAKQLKAKALPYDDVDCEPLLQELIRAGLIIEYEFGGKKYLHISGFRKHQLINRPSKARVPVYEDSMRSARVLTEYSQPDRIGSDRKGSDRIGSTTARKLATPDGFDEFRQAFPPRAGSQPWSRAVKAWRARIAEGVTPATMIAGAKRYAEFIRSTKREHTEYVKQAASFLGPDKHYENLYTPPAEPETAMDEILRLNSGAGNARSGRVFEAEPSPTAVGALRGPVRR